MATDLSNNEKEEWIDKLLNYMNDQLEEMGSTIDQYDFDFSVEGEDSIHFQKQYSGICDSILTIILKLCTSRGYIRKKYMNPKLFSGIVLTQEGRNRALSSQNIHNIQPTQTNFNINTLNTHAHTQIGNYNTQEIQNIFQIIEQKIAESSEPEEKKEEAKSRLDAFLSNPLVDTILRTGITATTSNILNRIL